MLLDALVASLLSTIVFLGLFTLTENILLADAENLKMTVSSVHLRSVEGYWRRARFLDQDVQVGDRRCRLPPKWLQSWCDEWSKISRHWMIDGILCVKDDHREVIATIRLGSQSSLATEGASLQHRWSTF